MTELAVVCFLLLVFTMNNGNEHMNVFVFHNEGIVSSQPFMIALTGHESH